jgi:peptidoglycan/xylan/chitin deacetylase (PgdA/CDA1 family)
MQQQSQPQPGRSLDWKTIAVIIIILMLACLPAGCRGGADNGNTAEPPPGGDDPGNGNDPGGGEGGSGEPEPDYEALGVNELGQIMVLMYHRIEGAEAEWARTPENFRKDLRALYEAGYRLVSLNDVLDGKINTPAGTTPVVLTFDDGTAGQFRLIEKEGRRVVDPDCAVGILEEFHRAHPHFGLAATFYIYYVATPFEQPEYVAAKLAYLAEKGFEIGNHTYGHGNLRSLTPEGARRELAYHVKSTREYLPGYRVRSLALPYGAHPEDKSYIMQGSYEGIEYHHEGILLVGSNPAPSPFAKRFDPAAIPRIRASEMLTGGQGLYDWLEYFKQNPQQRYVSDGNADTVAAPERLREEIDEAKLKGRRVVTY